MLLASFGSRRPTVDADALARNMASDQTSVSQRVARTPLRPHVRSLRASSPGSGCLAGPELPSLRAAPSGNPRPAPS
ncbi:hypothetical protein [Brevibacterium yomogidense]|uniref:hypothetical protein n=1 Tax=Brevibacterium yomogidense TaxID=946573 RepID=UPI0038CC0469